MEVIRIRTPDVYSRSRVPLLAIVLRLSSHIRGNIWEGASRGGLSGSRSSSGDDGGRGGSTARRLRVIGFSGHTLASTGRCTMTNRQTDRQTEGRTNTQWVNCSNIGQSLQVTRGQYVTADPVIFFT